MLLYTFAQLGFQLGWIVCLIQSLRRRGNAWSYDKPHVRRCTSRMASSSCAHVCCQDTAPTRRTSLGAASAMVWRGTWRRPAARVEWERIGVRVDLSGVSVWWQSMALRAKLWAGGSRASRKMIAPDQSFVILGMLVGSSGRPLQLRAFSTPPKERSDEESGQVSQGPSMYLQKASSTAKDLVDRSLFHNYPRSLRQLALKARSFAQSNGQGPDTDKHGKEQRPTKDELLRIARGFWTRMRIRFKWFTIRGFRRFNIDDLSAFFTLGGLGTAIWVIVGTTTFVSVIFATLNALNLQEWFAMQLTKFLSRQTGFTIVCGSAIVPKWKEGRISFKDVVISRRAEPMDPERLRAERQSQDTDTRRLDTHLLEMRLGDEPTIPAFDTGDHLVRPIREEDAKKRESHADTNFSMFELRVDSIDVQLSLRRWLDGHGFLHKMDVRGIRGIVDRRHVFWDPDVPYDPRLARRTPKPNDIDLDSFTIEDFLVTVYQPGDFRPFNVSIFNASFPRLRTQWLFYDMLNADSMTGQLDGCLFSLHKPQSAYHTPRSMYSKVGKDHAPYIQNWVRLATNDSRVCAWTASTLTMYKKWPAWPGHSCGSTRAALTVCTVC